MFEQIIKDLENVLKDSDNEFTKEFVKWTQQHKSDLNDYKNAEKMKIMARNDLWGYYEKLHSFAGGKTWYKILNENSGKYLDEKVVKIYQNNIKKRNSNISKKLSKFEITEITSKKFAKNSDGFHGTFVVETNKGKKIIDIQTIYAGGHNIQILHTRTLIKVS